MVELTWNTATEWDNAQSESGVVHESVTNTDHSDATIVKQGYSAASPYLSADLQGYWPLHEDSGSTANDFSGNSNDGSITGATVGSGGLLGTSAYSFDGADDYVEVPSSASLNITGGITIAFWTYVVSRPSAWYGYVTKSGTDAGSGYAVYNSNPNLTVRIDGSGYSTSTEPSTGAWHYIVVAHDNSGPTTEVDVDGTTTDSLSTETLDTTNTDPLYHGTNSWNTSEALDGRLWDVRVYNRYLTSSERQTLYDVVASAGSLTTASKAV